MSGNAEENEGKEESPPSNVLTLVDDVSETHASSLLFGGLPSVDSVDAVIGRIMHAAPAAPPAVRVNLSSKHLTATDAHTLSQAVCMNRSLTCLNLSDNQLGDAGAAAIASALGTRDCLAPLRALSLDANWIGDAGAAALARTFKSNTTLELLSLCHNSIGDVGGWALVDALVAAGAGAGAGADQPADGAGSTACKVRALFLGFNALRDPRIEVELRDLLAPAATAATTAALKGKKKGKKTGGGKNKSAGKGKGKGKKGKKGGKKGKKKK
eukprot:g2557.t1